MYPIGDDEYVDLDSSLVNHRSKKNNDVSGDEEVMVNFESQMENYEGSKKIITPGADVDDGIIKIAQKTI